MRIVHLSDTHLFSDEARHYGVVDTTAALRRVLDAAGGVPDVDAVVVSGDLSDDGSAGSYRLLRELIEPWAAERGAVPAYVMGNHDARDAAGFEQVIGERTGVVRAGELRIMRLDSSVPGAGYGRIDPAQLTWLETELATSDAPTVVVLHHPPIPAISPLLAALELQDPEDLLDICAQAEVQAILSGHYHHSLTAVHRGVAVIVAPGIANTTDVFAPAGHERAAIGSGFAVVDLPSAPAGGARVTFHRAPSPADGELIFDLGPDEVAVIAAKAGPPA